MSHLDEALSQLDLAFGSDGPESAPLLDHTRALLDAVPVHALAATIEDLLAWTTDTSAAARRERCRLVSYAAIMHGAALLPELRQEQGEEGVLQANPLAQERDGKAQVDSADDDEEEALVPLDPDGTALKVIERGVYGPCGGPGSAGQYAYLASIALFFCAGAYFQARCFPLIDPSLELAGWAYGILLLVAGAVFLASSAAGLAAGRRRRAARDAGRRGGR